MKWLGLIVGVLLLTPAIALLLTLSAGAVSLAVVQPAGTFVLAALAIVTIIGAALVLLCVRAISRRGA